MKWILHYSNIFCCKKKQLGFQLQRSVYMSYYPYRLTWYYDIRRVNQVFYDAIQIYYMLFLF